MKRTVGRREEDGGGLVLPEAELGPGKAKEDAGM